VFYTCISFIAILWSSVSSFMRYSAYIIFLLQGKFCDIKRETVIASFEVVASLSLFLLSSILFDNKLNNHSLTLLKEFKQCLKDFVQ
ncbi:hypothetical protein EFM62_15345, partial [Enterococcus faecium]|nr:hypothetical protein [Enterococcus faecium]